MAVAHDEQMMDLIRARLANSERPLTRLLRAFYRLATLSPQVHDETETNDSKGKSQDYSDQLYMQHASFLVELNSLTRLLSESRGIRMLQMTALELEGLEKEKVRLESEALEETSRIAQLELELEDARRERKNKIQYEEIGKEVRRYGDRFTSAGRISGLAKEITNLLDDQRLYTERWKSRRDQFDTVVSNLEVLQESIKEEKADADRKKALNDDDADDDEGRAGEEEEADQSGIGEMSKQAAEADMSIDLNASAPTLNDSEHESRPSTLNPTASVFLPEASTQGSAVSTPDNRSRLGARTNYGTPQPIERPSSRTEQNVMEIDVPEVRVESTPTRRDLDDDATMEDGEEREEVEEGQEMESD